MIGHPSFTRNDTWEKTKCTYYQGSPFLQIRSCLSWDPRPNTLDFLLQTLSPLFIKGSYCNNLEEIPGRCSFGIVQAPRSLHVLLFSAREILSQNGLNMLRGSLQFADLITTASHSCLVKKFNKWTLLSEVAPPGWISLIGLEVDPYATPVDLLYLVTWRCCPSRCVSFLAKCASVLVKCVAFLMKYVALLISLVTLPLISLWGSHFRCLTLIRYLI